jgi:sialic acid synthase SpsE
VDKCAPFVDIWKVASAEFVHRPLIDVLSVTEKPIILSTGGCHESEIDSFIDWCGASRNWYRLSNLALLECVSAYPSEVGDYNFHSLLHWKERGFITGVSDHSYSQGAIPTMALALGGTIFEVHFDAFKSSRKEDSGLRIPLFRYLGMIYPYMLITCAWLFVNLPGMDLERSVGSRKMI